MTRSLLSTAMTLEDVRNFETQMHKATNQKLGRLEM